MSDTPDPTTVREATRQATRQAVAFRTWTLLIDMPDVGIYVEADPTISCGVVVTAKASGQRLINEIVARASAPHEQSQDDRDSDVRTAEGRKPVDIGTGMPATTHLEAFGQYLREAFGAMPYHVESSIHGKTWRDVDVRIMLDDDRFDALFPGYASYRQRDAWWALVCSAISELGRQRTGLPIDFQVQRTSEANEKFPGARNPLFVGHADEAHRPTFAALDARDAKGGEQR